MHTSSRTHNAVPLPLASVPPVTASGAPGPNWWRWTPARKWSPPPGSPRPRCAQSARSRSGPTPGNRLRPPGVWLPWPRPQGEGPRKPRSQSRQARTRRRCPQGRTGRRRRLRDGAPPPCAASAASPGAECTRARKVPHRPSCLRRVSFRGEGACTRRRPGKTNAPPRRPWKVSNEKAVEFQYFMQHFYLLDCGML